MLGEALLGTAAGAVGTVALNAVTYGAWWLGADPRAAFHLRWRAS